MTQKPIFYKLFRDFTNDRKKTNRGGLAVELSLTYIPMSPLDSLANKTLSDTYRTILTIFRVTEILISFRLVLKGKTDKQISE